jgi:hypothetical protein
VVATSSAKTLGLDASIDYHVIVLKNLKKLIFMAAMVRAEYQMERARERKGERERVCVSPAVPLLQQLVHITRHDKATALTTTIKQSIANAARLLGTMLVWGGPALLRPGAGPPSHTALAGLGCPHGRWPAEQAGPHPRLCRRPAQERAPGRGRAAVCPGCAGPVPVPSSPVYPALSVGQGALCGIRNAALRP